MLGHVEVVFGLEERGEEAFAVTGVSCMVIQGESFRGVWNQQEEIWKSYYYLKSNRYFEALTDYDKKYLALMMIKSSFKPAEILAQAGTINEHIFFIIYG